MTLLFKIFDERYNAPHTLFHGVNGTKQVPFDKWVNADLKLVTDGSGVTEYVSGFHLLPSFDAAINYLRRFKNTAPKVIVEVQAKNVWKKEHSPHDVYLAEHIKVTTTAWKNRVHYMKALEGGLQHE